MNIINTVKENITKYKLIDKGDCVIVALSGGKDSISLFRILLMLRNELEFNIVTAHVNHGIRGDAADRDEEFVKRLSEEMNITSYTKKLSVDKYAKEKGISVESAGREVRYEFFKDIATNFKNAKIAVAHNKNDQAETLIMRIMRGTGIDGLRGMEFKTGDIIRPLLNITRDEIEEFIEESDFEFAEDFTNKQAIYSRNKIRIELIPYIEKNFNPKLVDSIWRLSEIAKNESAIVDRTVEKEYDKVFIEKSGDEIVFSKELKDVDKIIVEKIIRKALNELFGNLQGVSSLNINDSVELIKADKKFKRADIVHGVNLIADNNYFRLGYVASKKETEFCYEVGGLEDINILEAGIKLNFKLMSIEKFKMIKLNKNIKAFDFDKISGKLVVRSRTNGDRFNPVGMEGTKKVKDFFIDEKIPRDKRAEIPILADSERILWIIDYRESEYFKVREDSKKILVVEMCE